jgi:hypothetical protein
VQENNAGGDGTEEPTGKPNRIGVEDNPMKIQTCARVALAFMCPLNLPLTAELDYGQTIGGSIRC